MYPAGFDLAASAYQEMMREGFHPDFSPSIRNQLAAIEARPTEISRNSLRDLRDVLWSSIDNDTSRDLDQIEAAERVSNGIRVLVGIADVDCVVAIGSPIDQHAASETTTVYTAVRNFPMLPEALSTDLTSLGEGADRVAIIVEMVVSSEGSIGSTDVYGALVRNKAQLTYSGVGAWLEGWGKPDTKVGSSNELASQLKLQDEAATALRNQRYRLGALNFDRVETSATIRNGAVESIAGMKKTRAHDLIEDFMIAANETIAKTLKVKSVPMIRRVVKAPERWARIVELAAGYGEHLPAPPDSGALNAFLERRRAADPLHYPDLSLAVVKLMGPGEYVMSRPGADDQGHFGLAATDYTHSTAPNRRFADLVLQRLVKATVAGQGTPYSEDELNSIARNCTLKEDAARKVERAMNKRVAAVALRNRRGETFDAIVTGVTPKGVFVRVLNPPVEGRLMRGEAGVDVGDRIRVTLLATDPERGYIDFGR
ncbi:MAG: RNB domain-containing ribonuclease [Acidobacteriaceae bacterium]|nr:RNB domain-containing ribonuclease [Acidobacteriaceae bacterium]MBV9782022.1 RNB domain-containing ribonuclease [Acidobacteriaceae bacterium]